MTKEKAVAMIRGALKSITIWVAALAEVLAEIAPFVPGFCADIGLDPTTTHKVLRGVAFAMIVCRSITTKSLHEKGAAPTVTDVPAPPAVPQALLSEIYKPLPPKQEYRP